MTESIMKLQDVWKIYKMGAVEVPALRGVSVEIKRGDFVAIIAVSYTHLTLPTIYSV